MKKTTWQCLCTIITAYRTMQLSLVLISPCMTISHDYQLTYTLEQTTDMYLITSTKFVQQIEDRLKWTNKVAQ